MTPGLEAWIKSRFRLNGGLRAGQLEVVDALVRGRRVVFVAPTGHGKSLCYQALAAWPCRSGTVLVFQPLKAIMSEQVRKAAGLGLRAGLINSDLDSDEGALAYVASTECRTVKLARSMDDEELPDPCGACDVCTDWPQLDFGSAAGRS